MSAPVAVLFLLAAPLQGGSDSCSTPDVIFGEGRYSFSLTTATTGAEGQAEAACSNTGVENDVWFEWTATSDGPARLYTCSLTQTDTKVAVYPGGMCPSIGTAITCDDNVCGNQSTVEWNVFAGSKYLIQLGTSPGANTGSGSFDLFIGGTTANNAALNGTAIQSTTDFGGLASRGIDGNKNGIYGGGSITHTNNSSNNWWEVDLGASTPIDRILLYNRLDCCSERLSNFRVSIFEGTNEVYGEDAFVGTGSVPTNGIHETTPPPGTTGDRVRIAFLGLNNANNGYLSLAEVEVLTGGAGIGFCFGDGGTLGCTACPCTNDAPAGSVGGCINSTSAGARLNRSGSAGATADTLRFDVSDCPPTSFGVLVSADNQMPTSPGHPCFSQSSGILSLALDGLRCVGGNLVRHGTRSIDSSGNIGTSNDGWGPPDGPTGGIMAHGGFTAGQTRHFQCFYLDNAQLVCQTGLNTTNALSVVFGP